MTTILISSRRAMATCGSLPPPSWPPFTYQHNHIPDAFLGAVEQLQQPNNTPRRSVPKEPPTVFVPIKGRQYVIKPDAQIDRHYYELCTLWELRGALRAGNIWVPGS